MRAHDCANGPGKWSVCWGHETNVCSLQLLVLRLCAFIHCGYAHTHFIHTQDVENVGSTHGITYLQDSSIGDDYEIFVGKRLLQRDVVIEQKHALVCVPICACIHICFGNPCLARVRLLKSDSNSVIPSYYASLYTT